MKKNTVVSYLSAILICILIFSKCGDKNVAPGYSNKAPAKRTVFDTVKLIGVFVAPDRKSVVHDTMYRVTLDSVEKLIETSNGVFKKLWIKDSVYWLPAPIALFDTATKKPLLDASGNQKVITQLVGPFPKEVVWDAGIRVDSAIKRFKGFLLADSVTKK